MEPDFVTPDGSVELFPLVNSGEPAEPRSPGSYVSKALASG